MRNLIAILYHRRGACLLPSQIIFGAASGFLLSLAIGLGFVIIVRGLFLLFCGKSQGTGGREGAARITTHGREERNVPCHASLGSSTDLIIFFIFPSIHTPRISAPQFYETLAQSFSLTEALWEGVFSLASSIFILLTGLSFVKLDRARVKWRIKLARAFSKSVVKGGKREGADGRWALWILPFVTVLREG